MNRRTPSRTALLLSLGVLAALAAPVQAAAPAATSGLPADAPSVSPASAGGVVVDPLSVPGGWMPGDAPGGAAGIGGQAADDALQPGCYTADDNTCEAWTTLIGQGTPGSTENTSDLPLQGAMHPDGGLYYTVGFSTRGNASSALIVAVDAVTGKQVWSDNGSDVKALRYRRLEVSPDGSRVFVIGQASGKGALAVAYDARSGERRWAVTWTGPAGEASGAYGIDVSPDGATLFVAGAIADPTRQCRFGSGLPVALAFSTVSGELLWRQVLVGQGYGDWASSVIAGREAIYVLHADRRALDRECDIVPSTGVTALGASDGQQLWHSPFNDGVADYPGGIGLDEADDRVFVTATSYNPDDYKLRYGTAAFDARSGEELWRDYYKAVYPGGSNLPTALAVDDEHDRVFVSGMATFARVGDYDYGTVGYEAATGSRLWTAVTGSLRDERAWASAVSADGSRLYLTGRSGPPYAAGGSGGLPHDLATVSYDTATGAQRWMARYSGDSPTQTGDDPVSVEVTPDGKRVVTMGPINYHRAIGLAVDPRDIVVIGYDEE